MTGKIRDRRVDFTKGMLIFCVVYGHSIDALCGGLPHSPVWLHLFVRTFDLPFFMVLSGYFLKQSLCRKSLCRYLVDRVTMLFVPICAWTLLRGHLDIFSGMYYFLWAVLCCSVLCAIAIKLKTFLNSTSFFGGRTGEMIFVLLIGASVVSLYYVNDPWNVFYLYPFFVFGLYARDLSFSFPNSIVIGLCGIFAVGLCFWSPEYTPWKIGSTAWIMDKSSIVVYIYRTILAYVGVVIMSHAFAALKNLCGGTAFLSVIQDAGVETLAIYILQSIFIQKIFRIGCGLAYKALEVHCIAGPWLNMVGYVIAPIVALFSISIMLKVIMVIKSRKTTKWVFGFKYEEVI